MDINLDNVDADASLKYFKPRVSKYVPHDHQPHPKQMIALSVIQDPSNWTDDTIELLFGGAAGGGKSDLDLDVGLQDVDVPGCASLIIRRTTTEMNIQEAVLNRAHEWLDPYVKTGEVLFSAENRRFSFRNPWNAPMATLTFNFLQDDSDIGRYQGGAFQKIIWDELTEFTEHQYTEVSSSRLRKIGKHDEWFNKIRGHNCPLVSLGTSNPGGRGHDFVFQRFFTDRERLGTIFIPSYVEDNPSIVLEPYLRQLSKLGPVRAAQLRHGDWSVKPKGTMFQPEWIEIVDSVPAQLRTRRYWDMAATEETNKNKDPDWTAGTRGGWFNGQLWIVHQIAVRAEPPDVEDLIKNVGLADGRGIPIHIEQEGGSAGKNLVSTYGRHVLPGYAIFGDPKHQNKISRAVPVSALAKAGNVKFLRGPWNKPLLDQLGIFPSQIKGIHDDLVDSVSGLLYVCTGGGAKEAGRAVTFPLFGR